MQIEYYPDTDMMSITLSRTPFTVNRSAETDDADIVLLFDEKGFLAETEIQHASERVDLDEVRRRLAFEEVRDPKSSAA